MVFDVSTGSTADPPADDPAAEDDLPRPSTDAAQQRPGLPMATRERFHDRDAAALEEVYDHYRRAVWSVVRLISRADHLAEEALQDTFVRAWQAAGQYDPSRDLGPWLLTIARHATFDLLRRELRPTRGGHEPEQDAAVEDPGIDRAWVAWQVAQAVRRLSDDEALIIRLTFVEGLTQSEIAERLDVPLGTVKSRSSRAHKRLAQLLAHLREDFPEPGNPAGPGARTPGGEPSGEGSDQP
jgi:RNA polymerase sigma-70 factor (ECF subfamily)